MHVYDSLIPYSLILYSLIPYSLILWFANRKSKIKNLKSKCSQLYA